MKKGLKLLILSDLLIIMSFGLISPIIAIFIKDGLTGGNAFAAGVSTSVTLVVKSLLEIPFGKMEDHNSKKRFLIIGTFIISFVPLGYFFIDSIYQLYAVQFVYGVGAAMAFPAFGALFLRYLDRGKEAYEWSVYGTIVGLGTAITAFFGGLVAQKFSFDVLFLTTSIVSIIGTFVLFKIPAEHLKPLKKSS